MKKAKACFADGGQISKADQMIAEMERKYGVSGNSQPAPPPVQQPAPQPAQPQQSRGLIGDAINIFSNRTKQIDKAAGYANGGKIVGPGTPTSDSIPAEVEDTGEPIRVANKERIVSHDQDQFLESIAAKMGFKNLDAMLEAGTGKPVGPTIKGGKKAAAGGWGLDNNPDEYAKAMQEQALGRDANSSSPSFSVGAGQAPTIYGNGGLPTTTDRVSGSLPVAKQPAVSPLVDGIRPWYAGASTADSRTGLEMERDRRAGAASAGTLGDPVKSALQFGVIGGESAQQATAKTGATTGGSASVLPQSSYSNEGRGIAAQITKSNPGVVVDNEFTQGGKSYTANPTSQQGISRVTSSGTSPLYTNIDPQKAVVGLNNQTIGQPADQEAQGLARIANANKIRGEMIANRDKDIPAGGYAPSILADRSVEDNAALDAMRRSSMISNLSPSQQAEFNMSLAKLALQDKGQNLASDNARYAAEVQDKRAAGHDQVIARGQDVHAATEAARIAGNPLDQQTKQLSLTQAQRISDLQAKAIGGDKNALASLQALTGKNPNADRYITVQGGEEIGPDGTTKIRRPSYVFDQQTGRRVQEDGQQDAQTPIPQPDKREVGKTYNTPKGPMIWRGNGWEAAR